MSSEVKNLEQITQSSYNGNGYSPLFNRMYTEPGKDVYSMFEYDLRTAEIRDRYGNIKFRQENVEAPKDWSQTAINIVASRYFKRKNVKPEYGGNAEGGEKSVKKLIYRVANTLRKWGEEGKYFSSKEEADTFEDELTYLLLSQRAAFNSPVWFNLGLYHTYGIIENGTAFYWDRETNTIKKSFDSYSHPQCSACFIHSVVDTLFGDHGPNDHSIFTLVETEARLFKYGSGNGTNYSSIRSIHERLSGGGTSSGLMPFLKVLDAGANYVKSGGKTRRAAKMVILNADHPEVKDLAYWKVDGERKARALAAFGYDSDMDGLYRDLSGQNSNNSIRITDDFMKAVIEDKEIGLVEITTGEIREKIKARELFEFFAKAAYISGDPGLQFHTTINNWHTCSNTAPINASNPCAEYMFLDDSACNLASLNLMKFRNSDGSFDISGFKHSVDIIISAQEIIVDGAGYPTYSVAQISHDFRPLGLGYANLGSYLMSNGIPYDSEEGFAIAGAITALMTGQAYKQSAKIASRVGPFPRFEENRELFLKVMKQHGKHVEKIPKINSIINLEEILREDKQVWDDVYNLVSEYGARNAQATVLAPTGTIGFMMDCDTNGVEPELGLVKYKVLVNRAGVLKLVNNTVPLALAKMGYNEDQIKDIRDYIDKTDTIEGAPHLKKEHLPVFDCSYKPANGERYIKPMGHVRMMAAIQPFVSGAISKTVNLPADATPKDVYDIYFESWKLGLKAISVYRDGSKLSQPLNLGEKKENLESKLHRGEKRELPQRRESFTIETKIIDEQGIEHQLHIICGEYEDGTLGEVRAQMFDASSSLQGMLNNFTVAISGELKYGVPLKKIISKHRKSKFDPSGLSDYPYFRSFTSIPNLIAGIIGLEYLGVDDYVEATGEEQIREKVRDPGTLRINQNKERLTFEYYNKQIKEIDRIMNSPIDDFKIESKNEIIIPTKKLNSNGKATGAICPGCGFSLPGVVGCTHCTNCGTQVGGGCPS